MADKNDWRAERAAQLAGTPFARPGTEARLEDTLPINSAWVSPKAAAVRPALPVRRGPMYGVIAVAAALVAAIVGFLIVRHDRREEVTVPVVSAPIVPAPIVRAPTALPAPAPNVPTPSVAAPAAPIVEAPPTPAVVAPVAQPTAAPVVREPKSRVAAKTKPSAAKTVQPKRVVKKTRSPRASASAKKQMITPAQETATIDDTPDLRPTPRRATRPPVCQPNVFSRAARPCRPSHDRIVRKPYYAK